MAVYKALININDGEGITKAGDTLSATALSEHNIKQLLAANLIEEVAKPVAEKKQQKKEVKEKE